MSTNPRLTCGTNVPPNILQQTEMKKRRVAVIELSAKTVIKIKGVDDG